MSFKGRNLSLTSYEDLFQTEDQRQEENQERVQKLPLDIFDISSQDFSREICLLRTIV